MTVSQELYGRAFEMTVLHRNWCKKQMMPFCVKRVIGSHKEKFDIDECTNRHMCFLAFINSDASIYKEYK